MTTERLEIRLDVRRVTELRTLAAQRGTPVAEVVRKAIDAELEAADLERRLAAAREIAAMEIDDMPDPEELSRQFNEAHAMPELDDQGNRIGRWAQPPLDPEQGNNEGAA